MAPRPARPRSRTERRKRMLPSPSSLLLAAAAPLAAFPPPSPTLLLLLPLMPTPSRAGMAADFPATDPAAIDRAADLAADHGANLAPDHSDHPAEASVPPECRGLKNKKLAKCVEAWYARVHDVPATPAPPTARTTTAPNPRPTAPPSSEEGVGSSDEGGSDDHPDDDDDGERVGDDEWTGAVDLWNGTDAADATDESGSDAAAIADATDDEADGGTDEGMDGDGGAVYRVDLGPFDMTVTVYSSRPWWSQGRTRGGLGDGGDGGEGRESQQQRSRRRHERTATERHLVDIYRRSFPGFAIGLTLTFEDEGETVLERGAVRRSRFEGVATFRLHGSDEGGEGNEGRDNDVPDEEEVASATFDAFMDPDDKVAFLRTFRRLLAGEGANGEEEAAAAEAYYDVFVARHIPEDNVPSTLGGAGDISSPPPLAARGADDGAFASAPEGKRVAATIAAAVAGVVALAMIAALAFVATRRRRRQRERRVVAASLLFGEFDDASGGEILFEDGVDDDGAASTVRMGNLGPGSGEDADCASSVAPSLALTTPGENARETGGGESNPFSLVGLPLPPPLTIVSSYFDFADDANGGDEPGADEVQSDGGGGRRRDDGRGGAGEAWSADAMYERNESLWKVGKVR